MTVVQKRVMTIFGTRPEAIKMAPVITSLQAHPSLECQVCITAQHREMLDQVLSMFAIQPHVDLGLMRPGQSLADLTTAVIGGVDRVLAEFRPDLVLVHGDTTTSFAATLAAFYRQIPVGHVEAGLRTHDFRAPWPEEMNRRAVDMLATLYFAPTPRAADNLLREGVAAAAISVTGNTVIDALLTVLDSLRAAPTMRHALEQRFGFLSTNRRIILVTSHRRENFGEGLAGICRALLRLADRGDIEIAYLLHMNPLVREPVKRLLGGHPRIHLIEPLEYQPFVYLMDRSTLVLTDSGGIQEEAPSLGKPVLVMRDKTERPEAVDAGTVRLVGAHDAERIVQEVASLLDDKDAYARMAKAHNPYGDGRAASRILERILHHFSL